MRAVDSARDGAPPVLRLRGVIDFVAAEQVAYRAAEVMDAAGSRTLVLDAAEVTAVAPVASRLLRDLSSHLREAGGEVVFTDPSGLLDRP